MQEEAVIIKLPDLGFSQTSVPKTAYPLLSYVLLDKLLNHFKLQYPHL